MLFDSKKVKLTPFQLALQAMLQGTNEAGAATVQPPAYEDKAGGYVGDGVTTGYGDIGQLAEAKQAAPSAVMGALGGVGNALNTAVSQPMQPVQQVQKSPIREAAIAAAVNPQAEPQVVQQPVYSEAPPELNGDTGIGRGQYDPAAWQNQVVQSSQYDTQDPQAANGTSAQTVQQPAYTETPAEQDLATRRNEMATAMVVGENTWKDSGFGALQGVANALSGQHKPIQTYGEMKRDRRVRGLAPGMKLAEGAVDEERKSKLNYRQERESNARIKELEGRPAAKAAERQSRFDLEQSKQLNRIGKIQAERQFKGLDTKVGTAKDGSGRLVTVDGNGKEEYITNPDGSFEYNLLEKPEEVQIEDGVNVDGSKKYRTVNVKGSQVLSNDSVTKYRDAMLKLQGDRMVQDESQFTRTMGQRQQEFVKNFEYKVQQDAKQFGQDKVKLGQWIMEQTRLIQSDEDLDDGTKEAMLQALAKTK